MPVDREKRNAWQRAYRKANGNANTKRYEKTQKGFLMRAYRNMLSRVTGVQRPGGNHHGLEILSKEEFYQWSLDNQDFTSLFREWEKSNYSTKLSPSVDRIDPRFGYELFNMQWVTHSENTVRGLAFRHRRRII